MDKKIPDRDGWIDFVEKRYFGNVQSDQIDEVMGCFHRDAAVIIRHGDEPERLFRVDATTEETALREFFRHLCQNFEAGFSDFFHVVDTECQRAACSFRVNLVPRADGLYAGSAIQELRNCNFFEFRQGLIGRMTIFYTHPKAGDGTAGSSERPTGYPSL